MTCEQAETLLPDYFRGSLDAAAKTEVLRHLNECASCKDAAELWNSLGAKLGGADQEQPSPALRVRLDLMLEAFREGQVVGMASQRAAAPAAPATSRWSLAALLHSPVLQFGLAAACLLLGLGVGLALRGNSPSPELNALRQEVHGTHQMVALALMQQQSASGRLEGINYTYRLQHPDPPVAAALLQALEYDINVDVRLAAIDALLKVEDPPALRRDLRSAFRFQKSPMVQIALVDIFSEARDAESRAFLKSLQEDRSLDPVVLERINWGLK